MNITRQHWTIIGVAVTIILVWYFFLRKKNPESSFRRVGKTQVQQSQPTALSTSNPIKECMEKCQVMGRPYDYCVWHCGGGDTPSPSLQTS